MRIESVISSNFCGVILEWILCGIGIFFRFRSRSVIYRKIRWWGMFGRWVFG